MAGMTAYTGSLTQDDQFDTTAAGTEVLVTAATKAVTKSTGKQTDKTTLCRRSEVQRWRHWVYRICFKSRSKKVEW